MSNTKSKVTLKLAEGYRTECQAGKHLLLIDQPQAGGGTDAGPTPVEYQLMALGGCLTAVARIIANKRKLNLRSMELEIEGDVNHASLHGQPSDNKSGFNAITVKVKLDADMTMAEKTDFLHAIEERCPISLSLLYPTPISILLAP